MNVSWEMILTFVGGGGLVAVAKVYSDWQRQKRGDKQDVVGAWQEVAKHNHEQLERLEARVTLLEHIVIERDTYIRKLERKLTENGIELPERDDDIKDFKRTS